MRRLAAAVAAGVLVATLAVVWPAPAGAIGVELCDSRRAPAPRPPRAGLSALVAQPPAEVPAGDPFDADASPSDLYATYGTAGLWWPVYDPGCNPASEWGMTASTGMGQAGLAVQNLFLDATAAVRSWAWRADWLEPLDDAMTAFTRSLSGFTAPLVGLALVVAGAVIAFRARRADLSDTAKLGGWAVAMMVLGVFALSAPTTAAGLVDDYGAGTTQLVERAVSGDDVAPAAATGATGDRPVELVRTNDPLVGVITWEVAYQAWLVGMFGSADSPTAQEYGPRFYRAMALTWDEAGLPAEELAALRVRRQEEFTAAAEDLRREDPGAFEVLQGKTAFADRIATGWVTGALLTGIATLFGFVAGLCVLLARLVARFGVMALPIVVPFGIVQPYRQPVVTVLRAVAGAVVTALMYTIAAGLMVRLTGALLSSSMPVPLVVALVLALTILLLSRLHAGRVLLTVAGARVAVPGLSSRGRRVPSDDDVPAPEPVPPARRSEERPAPAPPPWWWAARDVVRGSGGADGAAVPAAPLAGTDAAPVSTGEGTVPGAPDAAVGPPLPPLPPVPPVPSVPERPVPPAVTPTGVPAVGGSTTGVGVPTGVGMPTGDGVAAAGGVSVVATPTSSNVVATGGGGAFRRTRRRGAGPAAVTTSSWDGADAYYRPSRTNGAGSSAPAAAVPWSVADEAGPIRGGEYRPPARRLLQVRAATGPTEAGESGLHAVGATAQHEEVT